MTKNLDPRTRALGIQLGVEIKRSKWASVARFARELNARGIPTDYTNLTKRAKGTMPISMEDLLPMLDVLGVSFVDFINDAMTWHQRQSTESREP